MEDGFTDYCKAAQGYLNQAIDSYRKAQHETASLRLDSANAALHHAEECLANAGPEDLRKMFPL